MGVTTDCTGENSLRKETQRHSTEHTCDGFRDGANGEVGNGVVLVAALVTAGLVAADVHNDAEWLQDVKEELY